MHHIVKFIGMYLLAGLVIHWGWTIIYEIWIHHKVGGDRFGEAMNHYLGLKLKLYDKHAGIREAKMFLESLSSLGGGGWALMIAMTFVLWPVGLFEDIAVYRPMTDYVYEQIGKADRVES